MIITFYIIYVKWTILNGQFWIILYVPSNNFERFDYITGVNMLINRTKCSNHIISNLPDKMTGEILDRQKISCQVNTKFHQLEVAYFNFCENIADLEKN